MRSRTSCSSRRKGERIAQQLPPSTTMITTWSARRSEWLTSVNTHEQKSSCKFHASAKIAISQSQIHIQSYSHIEEIYSTSESKCPIFNYNMPGAHIGHELRIAVNWTKLMGATYVSFILQWPIHDESENLRTIYNAQFLTNHERFWWSWYSGSSTVFWHVQLEITNLR